MAAPTSLFGRAEAGNREAREIIKRRAEASRERIVGRNGVLQAEIRAEERDANAE